MNKLAAFSYVTTSQEKCSTSLNQRFNPAVRLLYSNSRMSFLTESNNEEYNDPFKIRNREKANDLFEA